MIIKTKYKPRFVGYYFLCGVMKIIDGIVTIISFPFGYTCIIYPLFCEWNLKQDAKRKRKFPKYEAPNQRPTPSPNPPKPHRY